MDWWYFFISIYFATVTADIGQVHTLNVQQDERVRLECTLTSKQDAEEAMWMRIRPPYNPDVLTYRDNVVYAPDRIELEQHRLSSSMTTNGTYVDTYFLTLTILHPTIDDEGRYICSKHRTIFAEYDLFIIIPPQFTDDQNFIQQRSIIEGSNLQLSCSAHGRPQPSITWFYRTNNDKHIVLGDGADCLDKTCEMNWINFTRDNPTLIECIADNKKSSRISKVFNIDVLYPPTIKTNVRTLIGSKNIEVFIECLSIANPSPSIIWFDDNRQEIADHRLYTIKYENQSSILSFLISLAENSKVNYYCQSNNSIGIIEKLINISDFIQFESKSTTIRLPTVSLSNKSKSSKSNRTRSRTTTTTTTVLTTTIASLNNSISCYPNIPFLFIFIICNFLKNTLYCTV
ncbi:unnamed protein product [Adineta steineri]|uniref:Ig-like domain-containing protein n=1 Tax=Adineta steineri TaxID=433720 RepID=A0A815PAZ5_9BILA|nr:unnamed protein product [Adineta steineri]CAF4034453.1 unnamed protein product [Adineta steineri]